MESFVLPKELRDGILAYLGSRPYVEVAEAINMLAQLEPITAPEDTKE